MSAAMDMLLDTLEEKVILYLSIFLFLSLLISFYYYNLSFIFPFFPAILFIIFFADIKAEGKSPSVVDRLTDPSKYTGAHKSRFDPETGKGLGVNQTVDKDVPHDLSDMTVFSALPLPSPLSPFPLSPLLSPLPSPKLLI